MLNVFTRELPPGNFTGILMFPLAKFYLRNMKIYQDKIMNYYNNQRVRAVENSNMLARLLDTCCPDIHLDLVEFYAHVKASALYLSISEDNCFSFSDNFDTSFCFCVF